MKNPCTCKRILKTSKKKLNPRAPKGTYQKSKRLRVEMYYKGEKRKDRSKYMRKYYIAHRKTMIAYQASWWKKYGRIYYEENKEHQKIINCKWLVRTGRVKI